ncbi:Alpha/Beta hydrolase [Cladorrhinum sp. PSN332]|nr:Alpha/Beta hydrolase [Cladorrhinum sp. PSN332]
MLTSRPGGRADSLGASRAAALVPASGFTFIDNSQGASAATAELSDALGTALDQIDIDGASSPIGLSESSIRVDVYLHPGNPVDRLHTLFQELGTETSKYTNSKISDPDIKKYQCDLYISAAKQPLFIHMSSDLSFRTCEAAQLISATWTCALATYTQSSSSVIPDSTSHRSLPDHVLSPSLGGTFKVMATHIVSPLPSSNQQSEHFPALVIAIRRTASTVDGIANLNGEPRDASEFLSNTAKISAHSGFLKAAEALSEIVEQRIRSSHDSNRHVIFTGHSAGGAVATLLYLRFRELLPCKERSVSCVTFGAPPCVSGIITELSESAKGVHLNVVNEFDMAYRQDGGVGHEAGRGGARGGYEGFGRAEGGC